MSKSVKIGIRRSSTYNGTLISAIKLNKNSPGSESKFSKAKFARSITKLVNSQVHNGYQDEPEKSPLPTSISPERSVSPGKCEFF